MRFGTAAATFAARERVDNSIRAYASEELPVGGPGGSGWYAEYLGHSYRAAVEAVLAPLDYTPLTILKADLWNEAIGGSRDVAGNFQQRPDHRFVGVDLAFWVCARARSRVEGLWVVRADIRALPFRTGTFDAVLDLSTLDHLPEPGPAQVVGEYRRVLRERGALLLVFWQRSVLMRLRLLVKRLLGRAEKADQHYLSRTAVRARLGEDLVVFREFVAGSLLVPPRSLMDVLMRGLPGKATASLMRWVARLERSGVLHPLLTHLAGLYGIAARRRQIVQEPE
jgi:SAM-dependent methyltransferase